MKRFAESPNETANRLQSELDGTGFKQSALDCRIFSLEL